MGEIILCGCVRLRCVQEREKDLFPPKYCLSSAKIKAQAEPTTHLKKVLSCFPLYSCQHDSFLSTPLLPPSPVSLTFFRALALTRPAIQESCTKMGLGPVPIFKNRRFLQENNARILFCSLLPSVLCSLPYLLCGTLTPFTLSAANFPPYPSSYLQ